MASGAMAQDWPAKPVTLVVLHRRRQRRRDRAPPGRRAAQGIEHHCHRREQAGRWRLGGHRRGGPGAAGRHHPAAGLDQPADDLPASGQDQLRPAEGPDAAGQRGRRSGRHRRHQGAAGEGLRRPDRIRQVASGRRALRHAGSGHRGPHRHVGADRADRHQDAARAVSRQQPGADRRPGRRGRAAGDQQRRGAAARGQRRACRWR